MNEAKILACPFCGSEAKLTTTTCDLTIDHRHTVICSPGCGGSGQVAASPELALEAWNKRAGGREPEAAQNVGTIAGSFQRKVSVLFAISGTEAHANRVESQMADAMHEATEKVLIDYAHERGDEVAWEVRGSKHANEKGQP